MRIVAELDHKIRREIRDARAIDPLVSVVDLQEHLEEKFNRTFSRKYIAKLATKVQRQLLSDADRTKLEERLQETRENYRMMRERLVRIVYWQPNPDWPENVLQKPPLNKDVIEVAKNLVMLDLAILQAEATAGMYKKPVEVLAKEIHCEPLPNEVRAVVIAAWTRGGLLRQLADPSLADIPTHLPYRVEMWDRTDAHVRWLIAAATSVAVGHAALDAAIAKFPHERFTLRNGALVIREHPEKSR